MFNSACLFNMAESTLFSKVEDQLSCSVCLDTYTDPKLLQCFHEFCQKCLVKLVAQDQQGQLSLTCPICRQVTPVPGNGVAGLQPAFRINHLLDIMEEHKNKRAGSDLTASVDETERSSSSLYLRDKVCCPGHGGKEVELYCETCEVPVCLKCVLKGGRHHGHDHEELDKAFEKYKVEITASLDPVEKQLTSTKKALAELDACCAEISDQQAEVEANIHKTFEELQETLNARKTKLIHQLHQLTEWKLKRLAVQRAEIETKQAQLSSCLAFMEDSLVTDSQEDVLIMKSDVVKQVNEVTAFADVLRPITEPDIDFLASKDITTTCQNYGQVRSTGSPDPSECYATGINEAIVGKMATAVLHTVDYWGQPCKEPIQSYECELVSETMGTRTTGSIEKILSEQYQVSYQPTVEGRHQLHIKVDDQHIRGSPFAVKAKLRVTGFPWRAHR